MTHLAIGIASAYLLQLGIKAALALRQRAREPAPASIDLSRLTVMQPVTSGDSQLETFLGKTLQALPACSFVWILDRHDATAHTTCQTLLARFKSHRIRIVITDEPPDGANPKLWKQAAGLPAVETELLAVIDDDTWAPRASVEQLIHQLDHGATLATGLPSYAPAPGLWSSLVAEFVNSAAILTYLPATVFAEPLSINGMCYAVRTGYAREQDLFAACSQAITDDLAIAKAVRRSGGRIVQTTLPQHISTTVASSTHYRRLMHRWFVFSRILVRNEPLAIQTALVAAYGLHPLLLWMLFALSPFNLWLLVSVIAVRAVALALLNRKFHGVWRHSPISSVIAELLQPVFFTTAFFSRTIWWRKRKIRVHAFDQFEYLPS